MQKKQITYIEYTMLFFNIFAVLGITGFIYITTCRICNSYTAGEFLEGVKAIPWNPKGLFITVILLLSILALTFYARRTWLEKYSNYQYVSLVIDLILSLSIVYLLGFNYNGILLWVFANVISTIKDIKGKYVFVAISIISYIGTDHGLAAVNQDIYSIDNYIFYYDALTQKYLVGIYTVIQSLSIILFLIYCVYIILAQMGTITQIEELYKKLTVTNEELENANTKLQKYADIKEKMGETKERNRLAREIHDTLGHTLTGISAGIDACITTIEHNPKSTKNQLEVISHLTREGIQEVRRSVNELRPDALERLSLEHAIHKMISGYKATTNVDIHFTCSEKNLKFDEDEENAIYRVIQESVTNSVRHGNAKKIDITIDRRFSDLHISIKDDGVGVKDMKPGFGTRYIMERVKNLNGTVEFDGRGGFRTDVVIPIRWGENYD